MPVFRYGVFRQGEAWSVYGDDGMKIAFPSRRQALTRAFAFICGHRICGQPAELVVQDEVGRLVTARELSDDIALSRLPAAPIWDPFRPRSAAA